MTLDSELIREVTRLAKCSKLVNDDERLRIKEDIKKYRDAIDLSNGKDKKRNADWSLRVIDLGKTLKGWFRHLTGRDYFDMKRFQRCDKCE